jgi:nitroreductase
MFCGFFHLRMVCLVERMDVIRTRRSTRSFKPDAISEVILAEILEAGRLTPPPGNSQG